jgi:hypothetical protein
MWLTGTIALMWRMANFQQNLQNISQNLEVEKQVVIVFSS